MSQPAERVSEEERQRLLEQYKDLKRRAEALQDEMDRRQRSNLKVGRLALVGLALVAVGVGVYFATGSVLWAVLGTVVGVPTLVLLGVVVVAMVQYYGEQLAKKSEVPLGGVRVLCDPEPGVVRLDTTLRGDLLALWLCQYLDYCVVRYNAERWAPSNPGARTSPRVQAWLAALRPQLERGTAVTALDFGDLGGYCAITEARPLGRDFVDVRVDVARRKDDFVRTSSEAMGMLHRGDVLNDAFLAVAAEVLRMGQTNARELCAILATQCEVYQRRGNAIKEGAAVREALAQHPAFAARVREIR